VARLRIAFRSGEQIGEKKPPKFKTKKVNFEKLIKQMVFQKSKKSIWLFWFFKKRKKQRKEYI